MIGSRSQIVVRGVDQGQARRGRKLVYPSSERAQRGCTILEKFSAVRISRGMCVTENLSYLNQHALSGAKREV